MVFLNVATPRKKSILVEKLPVSQIFEKLSTFNLLRKMWNYIWRVLDLKLGQASYYIQ